MNNQQFRRLVLDSTPAPGKDASSATPSAAAPALGSRQRSSIPMTPRSLGGVDFAKQLRDQQAGGMPPPAKRFKSSAAPKGAKLAAGYTDRAQAQRAGGPDDDEEDKARRVRALEEQVKLGQMSEELFVRLRDEIIGGDVGSVHLVKGLDRRLLERVRRGEDVFEQPAAQEEGAKEEEVEEDVDAALDALEQQDVAPLAKKEKERVVAPRKRTRDDILRDLKAARAAAAPPQEERLGAHFKKIGDRPKPGTSRLETDGRGREVLVSVDADGNVKRRVRKAKPSEPSGSGLLVPDAAAEVLGADVVVPEAPKKVEEEEDDGDIFGGVGADYDPLAGLQGDADEDSGSESESQSEREGTRGRARSRSLSSRSGSYSSRSRSRSRSGRRRRSYSRSRSRSRTPPRQRRRRSYSSSRSRSPPRRRRHSSGSRSRSPSPGRRTRSPSRSPPRSPPRSPAKPTSATAAPSAAAPRNYFSTPSDTAAPSTAAPANPLADPGMLSALKRAARIAQGGEDGGGAETEAEAARLKRRREMLAGVDRDAQDIDEGFGGSMVADGEDEARGPKLSEWGAGEDGKGGGQKRKRGKKKRRGDGESVADVMAAVAKRKA